MDVLEPVVSKARVLARREQCLQIGGRAIVLPPGHRLPHFQRRDPTYDTYAMSLVGAIAEHAESVCVIDVGANIGDTTMAMIESGANVRVVAVEGDPEFLRYLHRNTNDVRTRVTIVEGFAGPLSRACTYSRNSTTGGFRTVAGPENAPQVPWLNPDDLLNHADPADVVVYKSDIDGLDIPLLARYWSSIDSRADVIWFEFDPASTQGGQSDTDEVIDHLSRSGRWVLVYDNIGMRMLTLPGGEGSGQALRGLTQWLFAQRGGHLRVPYLDVWAVRQELAPVVG
jgi:FkbM family methyltransferase